MDIRTTGYKETEDCRNEIHETQSRIQFIIP